MSQRQRVTGAALPGKPRLFPGTAAPAPCAVPGSAGERPRGNAGKGEEEKKKH